MRGICHGTGAKGSPMQASKAEAASSADSGSSWWSPLACFLRMHVCMVCCCGRHHTAALPSRQPGREQQQLVALP